MSRTFESILLAALILFGQSLEGGQPSTPESRGSEPVRRALDRGFQFLVDQQLEDGRWVAKEGQYPVAMTALAGMALLDDGTTAAHGSNSAALRAATDYLLGLSQPNGLITYSEEDAPLVRRFDGKVLPQMDYRYTFGQGLAMTFLSRVLGEEQTAERRKRLVEVLTKAANFAATSQTTTGGWGYVSAKDGNNFDEAGCTVVQIEGLLACRSAGIPVDDDVIQKAVDYLISVQNENGGIRYSSHQKQGTSRPALSAGALSVLHDLYAARITKNGRNGAVRVLVLAGGPTRDYRRFVEIAARSRSIDASAVLQTVDPDRIKDVVQPVPVLSGIPMKSLDEYDVVVAFDPDWSALTDDERRALAARVEAGAGLVLATGAVHTPTIARAKGLEDVRDLYPVEIGEPTEVPESPRARTVVWSESGLACPVFALSGEAVESRTVWNALGAEASFDFRPRAETDVWATFDEPDGPVLFASREDAAGKVLFIGTNEVWRLDHVAPDLTARFWSLAIRHASPRQPVIEDGTAPTDDADETLETAIAQLAKYCRKYNDPGSQRMLGHWVFLHHFQSQAEEHVPAEARRYFDVISRELLRAQAENGSWEDSIGSVYGTATRLSILARSRIPRAER